jgi:putative transposase
MLARRACMYRWRRLSPDQRRELLAQRKLQRHPWHSPPHTRQSKGLFLITATCYEHQAWIGQSEERMDQFSSDLLDVLQAQTLRIDAWVVLPNHYHAVVLTETFPSLLHALGRLHGRCSFMWNREDDARGRKVWFNVLERAISSDGHHISAIHYVHHNPVKHGHVKRWDDWKWSSAAEYLESIGREEAERRWREYPLLDFGRGWDD